MGESDVIRGTMPDVAFTPAARFLVRPGLTLAGRYALHEALGEGASGIVFRATDLAVGEEIAVKVLLAAPTERVLARFTREARVGRRPSHPHIVRVHDFVHLREEGIYLLSMSLVRGVPLVRHVVEQGPLRRRELTRMAQDLASALEAAHRIGVVHRDVKPENVLLGDAGEAFLLDFGSAAESGAVALTSEGFAPGTPEFMAPEQRSGQPARPAADIYSLGLTLAFASGAPSGGDNRSPAQLDRAMRRCLDPIPERRWRDGAAFARGLHRVRLRRRAAVACALICASVTIALARGHGRATARVPKFAIPLAHGANGAWTSPAIPELLRVAASETDDLAASPLDGDVTIDVKLDTAGAPAALRATGASGTFTVGIEPERDLLGDVDRAFEEIRRRTGVDRSSARGVRALTTVRPEAWTRFAAALHALDRHHQAEALHAVRDAVALDPAFARAGLLLALLTDRDGLGSRAEGRAALAALAARRAQLHPQARALFEATESLLMRGDADDAARRFVAFTQAHPGDRFALWLASRLAKASARIPRRTLLRTWVAQLPADPEPHNQLGYLLMGEDGDLSAAERELREAIRLSPASANGYDSLGDLLRRGGRLEEARSAVQQALRLEPGFVPSLLQAAGMPSSPPICPRRTRSCGQRAPGWTPNCRRSTG